MTYSVQLLSVPSLKYHIINFPGCKNKSEAQGGEKESNREQAGEELCQVRFKLGLAMLCYLVGYTLQINCLIKARSAKLSLSCHLALNELGNSKRRNRKKRLEKERMGERETGVAPMVVCAPCPCACTSW